jgi:hypothetical protein
MTLHLTGHDHCRAFLVASQSYVDPVTGNKAFRMMEVGDEPIVKGSEPPFTGVVISLFSHGMGQWHAPNAS